MAIYTSNYARKGQDKSSIAISKKPPEWYEGASFNKLAPTWEMVMNSKNGIITHDEYAEQYVKLLEDRCFEPTTEWLNNLPDPTYFLCYESPNDFCHRKVLAKYIEDKTGWVIPEWKNEKEINQQRQQAEVDKLLSF